MSTRNAVEWSTRYISHGLLLSVDFKLKQRCWYSVLCLNCPRLRACGFSHGEEMYQVKIQLRDENCKPLCMKFWINRHCEYGDDCKWSHKQPCGFEPWHDMQMFITEEPSKHTRLCKHLESKGVCDQYDSMLGCNFAHLKSEIRPTMPWNELFPNGNPAFDKPSMRWLSPNYTIDLREIPNHEVLRMSKFPYFMSIPISRM
jgi:hypothetical protein